MTVIMTHYLLELNKPEQLVIQGIGRVSIDVLKNFEKFFLTFKINLGIIVI